MAPTPAPADEFDYVIENAYIDDNGKLQISLVYQGESEEQTVTLIAASYNGDTMAGVRIFEVVSTDIDPDGYALPSGDKIRLFIWSGFGKMTPLARPFEINSAHTAD